MNGMKFRTKFLDKLSKTGVAEEIITMAFGIAMKMDENPFFWLLWKLSFDVYKEKALNELELTTDKTSTSDELWAIPDELVWPLRNELRYQYQLKHKDFLSGYASNNEELYNAMDNDIILTAGIYRKLYKYVKTHRNVDERNRVIFLLQSKRENFVFGSLKELGFTSAETEEFMDKADVIGSVFKAMVDKDAEYETFLASIRTPATSKPFARLGEMIDMSALHDDSTEAEETQEDEEDSLDESEEPTQLTAQVVFSNIELFKQFFAAVDRLDEENIDTFDVLDKEKEIRSLISSLEALP